MRKVTKEYDLIKLTGYHWVISVSRDDRGNPDMSAVEKGRMRTAAGDEPEPEMTQVVSLNTQDRKTVKALFLKAAQAAAEAQQVDLG